MVSGPALDVFCDAGRDSGVGSLGPTFLAFFRWRFSQCGIARRRLFGSKLFVRASQRRSASSVRTAPPTAAPPPFTIVSFLVEKLLKRGIKRHRALRKSGRTCLRNLLQRLQDERLERYLEKRDDMNAGWRAVQKPRPPRQVFMPKEEHGTYT